MVIGDTHSLFLSQVLHIAGGPNIPPPVGDWEGVDVTSDDVITQMVFAGLAGDRLEKINGGDIDGAVWKADFSELVTLDVRPGYENFGATAYFDSDLKLVRIFWAFQAINVYPNNSHWGHAKWVFRCSALLGITAIEHLLENHLIYANIGSTAAREALPKVRMHSLTTHSLFVTHSLHIRTIQCAVS